MFSSDGIELQMLVSQIPTAPAALRFVRQSISADVPREQLLAMVDALCEKFQPGSDSVTTQEQAARAVVIAEELAVA